MRESCLVYCYSGIQSLFEVVLLYTFYTPLERILELVSFPVEITQEVPVFNRTIFKVFLKEVNLRFI